MAIKNYSVEQVRIQLPADRTVHIVTWENFTANDTGQAYELPGSADRTVQISGTFDTSTVVIEGSNDGTNYETLTDPQGNALSKTASALEQVMEVTRYIRPAVSSVGASTDVDVTLLVRR